MGSKIRVPGNKTKPPFRPASPALVARISTSADHNWVDEGS